MRCWVQCNVYRRHFNSQTQRSSRYDWYPHVPGLWKFAISVRAVHDAVNEKRDAVLALSSTGYPNAAGLVAYAHASLFSLALSTLETALKRGYVQNIPGLTDKTLRWYPPRSVATAKGHLDQTHKNLRSTSATFPVNPTRPTNEHR